MPDYGLPAGPLSAYLGVRDANQRAGLVDTQNAAGLMGILAHAQQQRQLQEQSQRQGQLRDLLSQNGGNMETLLPQLMKSPEGIALAGHLAPLLKQQQDAKMAEQFSNTDKMSTDQIDALAQNLALRGHPGAAGMMSVADRRRALEQQKTAMTGMQSAPGLPAELAGPPSPDIPAQPAKAGVADFLINSKFPMIASAAKNLQTMIDRGGAGLTPAMVNSQLDRLTAMHQAEQSKIDLSKLAQGNRIELKMMPSPNAPQEPMVPVKEPDGRVIYVPRSQSAGREVGGRVTDTNVSRQTQQLGQALEKANLPSTIAVIRQAETVTPELAAFVTGPKSLLPDIAVPEAARTARQDVAKLFNITLKDRSGAAVTNQELERLKTEFGKGVIKTPQQLITAIGRAKQIVEHHYQGIAASYGPPALEAYNANLEAIGGSPFNPSSVAPASNPQVERAVSKTGKPMHKENGQWVYD